LSTSVTPHWAKTKANSEVNIIKNFSERQVMLVVGASGIVGRAALELFDQLPGWGAIGISRRVPDLPNVEHIALDLTNAEACARVAAELHQVTHVIYAALFEKPGLLAGWTEPDQMQTNLQMLKNIMVPLQRSALGLQHVSLLQGTKAYGAHVGRMRVPGKEQAPRVEHPNFYWLQEDWLKAQRAQASWHFTIWRPPLIIGHAIGAPMNVLSVIGIYGALAAASKNAGTDGFGWPGGVCGPIDAVDARLLARAFAWAVKAGQPEAVGNDNCGAVRQAAMDQTFNVTNGDVFLPSGIWPRLAECFGLKTGADNPQRLQDSLPPQAARWDQLVATHELQAPALDRFVGDSLIYTDVFFNAGNATPMPSPLLSTIKLRQAGFNECLDSEDMFVQWLSLLQQMRVLPTPR